ncbi:MAG: hypothetical protein P8Z41_14030 [Anaerolineales bacterium]
MFKSLLDNLSKYREEILFSLLQCSLERWVLAGMPETPEDLPTAVPGSETTQPAESAP